MLTNQQNLNSIRAIADHEAGGIIVPFDVVDKFKTWWNRNSDFALHLFKERPVFWFHLSERRQHEHGWQRAGTVLDDSFEMRDAGLYARARITDENLWQRILTGGIGWSTGTMPNLMKIRDDGYVERWPVVELSAAPTEHLGSLPNTTTVEIIRVHLPDIELSTEEILSRSTWVMSEGNGNGVAVTTATPAIDVQEFAALKQQMNDVTDLLRSMKESIEAPARQLPITEPVPAPDAPPPPIRVKYHWDNADVFTLAMRARLYEKDVLKDEQFMKCLVTKMAEAHKADEKNAEKFEEVPVGDYRHGLRSNAIDEQAYSQWHKRVPHLRANEVMATSDSGWSDLIDTLFESTAWHYFRMNAPVASLLPTFDMTEPNQRLTVVTGGPKWNKVAEVTNESQLTLAAGVIPETKVTMDNVDYATMVVGAATYASEQVYEETNIDLLAAWAKEYLESGAQAMDYILLNGDETDTDDNISHWTTGSGTTDIPSSEAASTGISAVLVLNGLRHLALTTGGTDNKVDAGGALDTKDIMLVRRKLGTRGALGLESQDLVFIPDVNTFYEIAMLDDYKSVSDVAQLSTLLHGIVGTWRGTPLKPASEATYELSNATGQFPAAHNGTKGSGIGVWLPGVRVGRFRKMNTEVTKPPHIQARAISSTFRIDLQMHQPLSIALLYNITLT